MALEYVGGIAAGVGVNVAEHIALATVDKYARKGVENVKRWIQHGTRNKTITYLPAFNPRDNQANNLTEVLENTSAANQHFTQMFEEGNMKGYIRLGNYVSNSHQPGNSQPTMLVSADTNNVTPFNLQYTNDPLHTLAGNKPVSQRDPTPRQLAKLEKSTRRLMATNLGVRKKGARAPQPNNVFNLKYEQAPVN